MGHPYPVTVCPELRLLKAQVIACQTNVHAKQRGLLSKIVGLKYFNVFGPNEWHKGDMRSLVIKAFEQVQRTGTNPDFQKLQT